MTNPPGQLDGRVALVTGSGRGIGQEIALELARRGASILVHYSGSEAGALDTVAQIEALGGTAAARQADITIRDEVVTMFEAIDPMHDRLDIVVNSAGVSGGGGLAELDESQLEWMLGVNLCGPLWKSIETRVRQILQNRQAST